MKAVYRAERLVAQHFGRTCIAANLLGLAHVDRALRDHPKIPSPPNSRPEMTGQLKAEVTGTLVAVQDEDFRPFRQRLAERLHDEHGGSSGTGKCSSKLERNARRGESDIVAG